ncbi:right-handed parallel beta-helix repeat-containing protein [bacterium]|nr:right-handed parallel beta-helix repeat-containing protein [bacterium]
MRIITFLAVLTFLFALSAESIPVRDCGTVLDTPGGRYRLVRNLECTSTAIRITADDIEFNLGRRTISGPGSGASATGILVDSADNVHILNGQINEVTRGILVQSASNNRIQDVSISDCTIGISLFSTSDSVVTSNTISSASSVGIFAFPDNVATVNNNRISENTIVNSFRAIALQAGNGNQIINNAVSDSQEVGIYLIQTVNDLVQGNTIIRSALVCIQVSESNGLQILNNTCNDNTRGIVLGNNLGEAPNNDNTIQGNTTNQNSDIGIFIVIGTGNVVQGNTSLNNTSSDMWDNFLCENTWTSNTFVTDNEGDGPGAGCIQ